MVHVLAVWARMWEFFQTLGALERLFTGVQSLVFGKMMFVLKCFRTILTFIRTLTCTETGKLKQTHFVKFLDLDIRFNWIRMGEHNIQGVQQNVQCNYLVLTWMFVFVSRQRALLVERLIAFITDELTLSFRNLLFYVRSLGWCWRLSNCLFRRNISVECIFGVVEVVLPSALLIRYRAHTVRYQAISSHFRCYVKNTIHWNEAQCWHIWIMR